MAQLVKFEDIIPPMNDKNWKIVSYDKVDIIHGEIYHNMDTEHWFYPTIKSNKQFTTLGFYKNSDIPDEIVRVAGQAPDLHIIGFEKV
jgi:hypothetical protein